MQRTKGLVLAAMLVTMAALGGAYIVSAQDLAGATVDGSAVNGTALNGSGCPGMGPHFGPHGLKPFYKPVDATTNETVA